MANHTHHIPIRPLACDVPPGKLRQMAFLASWCADRTSLATFEPPYEIILTPSANIQAAANRYLADAGDNPNVRTSAAAIAVPVTTCGHLRAAIIIAAESLEAFDHGHAETDHFASALLEEMLHVRHYAITFDRRGFIHYNLPSRCQSDLMELAYHMLDEYVVGRWKADLVEAELCYGGSLPHDIERGLHQLADLVRDAATAAVDITEAWARTAEIISGPTLGVLVREAGRRANRAGPSPAGDPSTSALFLRHLLPYWRHILPRLEAAFDDLGKADDELPQVASQLHSFLDQCGIKLTTMDDGTCWVVFVSGWADSVIASRAA
jgi:hypothetical protein